MGLDIQTTGISFEVGGFQDTVLVKIAEREHILGTLSTSGNTDSVFLTQSLVVSNFLHPIFTPSQIRIITNFSVRSKQFSNRLVVWIIHSAFSENRHGAVQHLIGSIVSVLIIECRIHDFHIILDTYGLITRDSS